MGPKMVSADNQNDTSWACLPCPHSRSRIIIKRSGKSGRDSMVLSASPPRRRSRHRVSEHQAPRDTAATPARTRARAQATPTHPPPSSRRGGATSGDLQGQVLGGGNWAAAEWLCPRGAWLCWEWGSSIPTLTCLPSLLESRYELLI